MSRTTSIIPRPPAEFLRALYEHLQLGCPDIGKLLERDASTVRGPRPRTDETSYLKKGTE